MIILNYKQSEYFFFRSTKVKSANNTVVISIFFGLMFLKVKLRSQAQMISDFLIFFKANYAQGLHILKNLIL